MIKKLFFATLCLLASVSANAVLIDGSQINPVTAINISTITATSGGFFTNTNGYSLVTSSGAEINGNIYAPDAILGNTDVLESLEDLNASTVSLAVVNASNPWSLAVQNIPNLAVTTITFADGSTSTTSASGEGGPNLLPLDNTWTGVNAFNITPFTVGISSLVVTSNGNVGIGTDTPAYPLDVYGDVHSTGTFYGNDANLSGTDVLGSLEDLNASTVSLAMQSTLPLSVPPYPANQGYISVSTAAFVFVGDNYEAQYGTFWVGGDTLALFGEDDAYSAIPNFEVAPDAMYYLGQEEYPSSMLYPLFYVNGTSVNTHTGDGAVGIGTSQPRAGLDIESQGSGNTNYFPNTDGLHVYNSTFVVAGGAYSQTPQGDLVGIGTGIPQGILDVEGAGSGNHPILFNSGNVGINTFTPAYPLDVYGDVRSTGTFYGNDANLSGTDVLHDLNATTLPLPNLANQGYISVSTAAFVFVGDNYEAQYGTFWVGGDTLALFGEDDAYNAIPNFEVAPDAMYYQGQQEYSTSLLHPLFYVSGASPSYEPGYSQHGSVGIGTSQPQAGLDIANEGNEYGDFTPYDGLHVYNSTFVVAGGTYSQAPQGDLVGIGTNDPQGILDVEGAGSGNHPILFNSGNVGINTFTPAYPLDVYGDVRSTGTFYGNGSGLTGIPSLTQPNTFTSTITVNAQDSNGYSAAFSSTIYLGAGGICYGSGSNCQYGPSSGGGAVSGGTANYVPLWTSTNSLSASTIYEDSNGNIAIGTTTTSSPFTVLNYINFSTSNFNTAVGYLALSGSINIGYQNTAVGEDALANNSNGNENTVLGAQAAENLSNGSENTILGDAAADNLSNGNENTILGFAAATALSSGEDNTILGFVAAHDLSLGGNNTILGYEAAPDLTSGGNNIVIGDNVGAYISTQSNQLDIDDLLYGNTNTGNIGIGTNNPQATLEVSGNVVSTSSNTIANLSVLGAYTDTQIQNLTCTNFSSSSGCLVYNATDFDLYTATAASVGSWRNTRTGVGP